MSRAGLVRLLVRGPRPCLLPSSALVCRPPLSLLPSSQATFSSVKLPSYPPSPHTVRERTLLPQHCSRRHLHCSRARRMPVEGYTAEERGVENTDSYKVYVKDSLGPISPFHDIPLRAGTDTFHAVIEIPRWTNAKMEIDTKSPLHPIIQDQKKGKLRYVANSFPHHGYIWNYGALPQTWENPNHTDEATGCKGDNDPVDICEIGHRVANRGDVLEVKLLGILAMVDDGETDWKIIVIDVNDPLASSLNNMEDVDAAMPGFKEATREWFRIYKMPDGKPENVFGLDGAYQGPEFAAKVVEETHQFWKQLVGVEEPAEDPGKLSVSCVSVEGAKEALSREEAANMLAESPVFAAGAELDSSVDTWHYVHLQK